MCAHIEIYYGWMDDWNRLDVKKTNRLCYTFIFLIYVYIKINKRKKKEVSQRF